MRAAILLGWALLAVVVAAWLALVEVFWLPLRLGPIPLPLSVLAAGFGNLLLVDQAFRRSGSRVVAVLPALVWLVVAVAAAIRRPEGDVVLVGGGAVGVVGVAFLLVGVVSASFAVGRVLGGGRRPAPSPGAPGAPVSAQVRDRAGSGTGGAR